MQYGADIISFLYIAALDKNVYAIDILKQHAVLDSYDIIIQFLLKEGIAGINTTIAEIGYTPFQYALLIDCRPALELLWIKDLGTNAIAEDRKTPIHFAAFKGRIKVPNIVLMRIVQRIAKEKATPLFTCSYT